MSNGIILSICIPTFNRASFLNSCLSAINDQLTEDLPIEIVISDNCSTDNTQEIITEFSNNIKFKSIKQKENLGPIKNILQIVKDHAIGEFCWIIGDDDYIVNGGIKSVVSILQLFQQIDFIFVKVDSYNSTDQLANNRITKEINYEFIQKFENLLQPKYSGIFMGELMAGIFRREIWLREKNIYKEIDAEFLSTLYTSYPHSAIYANQFIGKKAIYISTTIVIADDRAREWWDKASYIVIEHLLTLLQLYKSKGLNGKILRICKYHYINITFRSIFKFIFNKNLDYRNKISFKRYFIFLSSNPFITIKFMIFSLLKRIITLSKTI